MREADDAYSPGIDNLADGRSSEAIADFTQAIELDPQRANAYRLRGIVPAIQKRRRRDGMPLLPLR